MKKNLSSGKHDSQSIGMYGLPVDVKFCSKCVMSNQRPSSVIEFKNKPSDKKRTIAFNEDGVCEACTYAEKKKSINWHEREEELKKLLNSFRSKEGNYDVVVPGSGGKDSVMAAYMLKYKYNMHPLLVTWPPHMYTDMGWQNFRAWVNAGFDCIAYTPNQKVHRLLTKLAFENLVHPFQPFIIGQKNVPTKVAAQQGIPLVFYGENEAEYGNPIADNKSPTRDPAFYTSENQLDDIFLGGVNARSLLKEYNLSLCDLEPYLPVSPYLAKKVGMQVHYLGYYVKWDPQESYYYSVENTDFMPNTQRSEGSYSKYNSIDDKMDWFHFYTYFIKFGIGRTTYDVSQEIRNGHLTRQEGVWLVHRFDGEFPKLYFKDNLEYMQLSEKRFYEIIDKARPPHLWEKQKNSWHICKQVR